MEKQKITSLFAQALEIDPSVLKDTKILLETLDFNSISIINFIALLNEQFNIVVSPSLLLRCNSLEDIIDTILTIEMNEKSFATS